MSTTSHHITPSTKFLLMGRRRLGNKDSAYQKRSTKRLVESLQPQKCPSSPFWRLEPQRGVQACQNAEDAGDCWWKGNHGRFHGYLLVANFTMSISNCFTPSLRASLLDAEWILPSTNYLHLHARGKWKIRQEKGRIFGRFPFVWAAHGKNAPTVCKTPIPIHRDVAG